MINKTIILSTYWIIFSITLIFLFYIVARYIVNYKKLKKFVNEIREEEKIELTNDYMKLMRGEIEIIDFYEKEEMLGQLYTKIFMDYKNNLIRHNFKSSKGKVKVK
jgi:hypothetical protein